MEHSRKPKAEISPRYEDAGLFRNGLSALDLWLIPVVLRTRRGDLLVSGFAVGELEISILFAGRRVAEAAPLVAHLEQVRARQLRSAMQANRPPPALEDIRCPVWVEGAWRPRVVTREDGWAERSFHLIAARWRIGAAGPVFGRPPAV